MSLDNLLGRSLERIEADPLMIQTLPKTIGLEIDIMIELDAMRKQRNVTDYSGDIVTIKEQQACLHLAQSLWDQVNTWLRDQHPELLV